MLERAAAAGAVTVTVAVLEIPARVAVMMAVRVEFTDPAVALNAAVVEPAATVTVGGTVRAASLLVSDTAVPAAGAAARVTLQAAAACGPIEPGVQLTPLNTGCCEAVMVAAPPASATAVPLSEAPTVPAT